MLVLVSLAWGAEPEPAVVEPVPDPVPELRAQLQAALEDAERRRAGDQAEVDRLHALVEQGEALLDERSAPDARAAAASALADAADPGGLWLLRAAAADPDPVVRLAASAAALRLSPVDGPGVAQRVVEADTASRATRLAAVDQLGEHGTESAARALYAIGGETSVPASVRARAVELLRTRYASVLPSLGPPPGVVDPLGGVAFVTANGVVGGIVLSSVGVFGSFDGATAIGATGGGAIGVGTGVLYARSQPLTLGEGLAYASGVSLGLTYGLWTTTAAEGAWKFLDSDQRAAVAEPAAVFRAVGVGAGAAIGGWATTRSPTPWDVLEVDAATYLGSAVALGATALATYHPPAPVITYTAYGGGFEDPTEYVAYRKRASQWLAGSELAGATVGLGLGVWLAPRWHLDWNDAAFGAVAGAELAWVGQSLPIALGADIDELKGSVRLPWNAGVAAGLAWSELRPVSLRRSAVTGLGAGFGNALGEGVPLLAKADDRVAAGAMVATGLAGGVGAYLAEPLLAPDGGDAVMLGVGTAAGTAEAALVGQYLVGRDTGFDSDQAGGLALLGFGLTGAGLLAVAPLVDPDPADMVLLGTGGAWGGYYGVLIPIAANADDDLLPAAIGVGVGLGLAGLAISPPVALRPAATVLPQLAALSGGTLGALGAGLASAKGDDVALGALIGSTVGFGGGAAIAAAVGPSRKTSALRTPRVPGAWAPLFESSPGPSGAVPVFGVRATGW